MKISLNWLKDYLNLTDSPEEIANLVSLTGIEVAEVIRPNQGLKKIVVGHVNSTKPHPDSDHMTICQVDVGEDEDYQIVCGAPNIAAGQDVIVAMPNSRIAGNEKIKKGKLRGVVSMGMICALQEIGFSDNVVPEKYKEGIYVFEEPVTPGEDVYSYLGMDDAILDFDITPNRADTLGMNGAAYEMGAIYNQPIEINTPKVVESNTDAATKISVTVDDNTKTRQYRLRVIENVEIKSSPMWMQIRLWNAGIRPINNIVDITNYVLLEFGQPMHAFDMDKLSGKNIHVRKATDKEKVVGVDEKEYELNNNDIVIADDEKVISIAGVMGGKGCEIDKNTKNILVESAVFDETNIRKTAQHLNARSESSIRFEKGIDNSMTAQALDRAAELINTLANGEVSKGQVVGKETKVSDKKIDITADFINKKLGLNISQSDIIDIFNRLGFESTVDNEIITVSVPARRFDISIQADLVEEVIRLYGYDNLEGTLPIGKQTLGHRGKKEEFLNIAKKTMLASGFDEAITYSMVSKENIADFEMEKSDWTKVAWPMTEDHEFLRTDIVSGLLNAVKYNQARKQTDISLFENGRVFLNTGNKKPDEREYIAGVMTGNIIDNDWHHQERKADFFDLKEAVEQLLSRLNRDADFEFIATKEYKNMHPGQTANILTNGDVVGFIGKIHPSYQKELGITDSFVFQLDLDKLYNLDKVTDIYEPISKYPAVSRDIAILVRDNISSQDIVDIIIKNSGKYLVDIKLFDVYQGKNIEKGYKSMAYSLVFQNSEETLTDEQITKYFDKIVESLKQNIDADIR